MLCACDAIGGVLLDVVRIMMEGFRVPCHPVAQRQGPLDDSDDDPGINISDSFALLS